MATSQSKTISPGPGPRLEWLIVGGGMHGTALSRALLTRGVPARAVRVLDPWVQPLARWRACVGAVGMRYLRSPAVHHLDGDPFSLMRHAERSPHPAPFAPPYNRPALSLFHEHCAAVIETHGLDRLRLRGRATHLALRGQGYRVETDQGVLEARRVVLALGASEQPHWPRWALRLLTAGAPVHHVFEVGFDRARLAEGAVIVAGGGISAVQLALALAREGRPVTLWRRHPLRVHTFDSDPGWMGPRYMRAFEAEGDLDRRRGHLRTARHRGSVPPHLAAALSRAVEADSVRVLEGVLFGARGVDGGVVLETEAGLAAGASVVLCTGFAPQRPGGQWIDDAILAFGLPCAACRYPMVDAALQWRPNLHVMGPLAELELGPAARNLIGARRAAERLTPLAAP